jgi:hypothetical protein
MTVKLACSRYSRISCTIVASSSIIRIFIDVSLTVPKNGGRRRACDHSSYLHNNSILLGIQKGMRKI